MIYETDKRIIIKMIETINRNIDLVNNHGEEIKSNYVYSDSLLYEFEKLYQDLNKVSFQLIVMHPEIPFHKIRAIRNRIAHEYENVSIDVLVDSVKNDFPVLITIFNNLLNS